MENHIFREIVEYLLKHCFHSKKEIAHEIGVSYRVLLNCCTGKGTHRAMNTVSAKILRYCVKNRITLGDAISLPI